MYKLLDFPDYGVISEVKDPLDAEMLLDFILYVCMAFLCWVLLGINSFSCCTTKAWQILIFRMQIVNSGN